MHINILHAAIFKVRWVRVLLALMLVSLTSVGFQLLLPSDRSSSQARLGNIDVPRMTSSQIRSVLESLDNSSFASLQVGNEQYTKQLQEIGLRIDIDEAVKIASYDTRDKLIPFSALWRFSNSVQEIPYVYTRSVADDFIAEIAEISTTVPQPASIVNDDGSLKVSPAEPGFEVDPEEAVAALGQIEYQDRVEIEIPRQEIEHEFGTQQALELIEDIDSKTEGGISIQVEGESPISISENEITGWYEFTEKDGQYSLQLNEEAAMQRLDQVANQLSLPASNTVVELRDGKEVGRTEGRTGATIDRSRALSGIKQILEQPEGSRQVSLNLVDVKPRVVYNNTFTQSSAGLKLFLQENLQSKGIFGVSVIDLDSGLQASYNGSQVFLAASTYKVYVAYYAASQIEKGNLSWNTKLPSGQTIAQCYEKMIVISDNPCAIAIRDKLGAQNINNALRNIGLPTAGFASSAITSANELSLFLRKLHNGELMNQQHTNQLIDMMRRQIHRLAIPTGVAPTPVADKGGFVLNYNHDTGIVYGQNRTYAITILSQNKSKSQLAAVARDVHEFLAAN